jgi:virginiamycin B lyase
MVFCISMRRRLLIATALALGISVNGTPSPRAESAAALSGRVTSAEEGPMEGVLVSAKKTGSTVTLTVASDHDGHFAFPENRLTPGHYVLAIRAVGYDLDHPVEADVPQPSAIDLTLRRTEDLAAQLTNAEWFESFPGTPAQKQALLECMSCHTFERIARSTHTADEWVGVLQRMAGYANNTTPAYPQRRAAERKLAPERARKTADYLATINLSTAST